MAISLSCSVVSRISISSTYSFMKANELGYSSVLLKSVNPFRLNCLSTLTTSAAACHSRYFLCFILVISLLLSLIIEGRS